MPGRIRSKAWIEETIELCMTSLERMNRDINEILKDNENQSINTLIKKRLKKDLDYEHKLFEEHRILDKKRRDESELARQIQHNDGY